MSREVTTVGFPLLKAQTGTGASTEFFNVMADAPPTGRMKGFFTAGVSITGSPTAVIVSIEGSINGIDWRNVGSHTLTADELTASVAVFAIGDVPVPYVRGNLTTLTGGTNPAVTMHLIVNEISTRMLITDGTTDLELDSLVKSVPVTDTFHHLGHEGKVFIHSDRHNGIADAADFDYMIRVPAGNANRQVHLRFNFIGRVAGAGTLDVDIVFWKDSTVSADGTEETIVSTNDANVKTTGVEIYHTPTVTDIGTHVAHTMMAGEKKSASSKEQSVPEWILAPDGVNERLYIFRLTNNSGGAVDIVNALFFYDSEAA